MSITTSRLADNVIFGKLTLHFGHLNNNFSPLCFSSRSQKPGSASDMQPRLFQRPHVQCTITNKERKKLVNNGCATVVNRTNLIPKICHGPSAT